MLLDFPTDGRCSQHGSRCSVETANKELSLALENVHDVAVVSTLDGLHNQIAGFYHTTEEDKCLGARECCKVGTSLTKHFAGEFINLLGQLVSLASGNRHLE